MRGYVEGGKIFDEIRANNITLAIIIIRNNLSFSN